MGPFCSEQGTSSHETIMDLASTDEKVMFLGEEVGSEIEISEWSYKLITSFVKLTNRKCDNNITIIKYNGINTK